MSKRAVILHGTDGSPTELAWQKRLKRQLEESGYEVYFPQLPECHTPNLAIYDRFLQDSGWDFEGNIIIGHSSGATAVLHLLLQDWFPKARAAVLVGTFLNEDLVTAADWYVPGQFDSLFVEEFSAEILHKKAEAFYFVHSDDDPFCDYATARQLCDQLDGTFVTMHGAGHIGKAANIADLPALTDRLKRDGLL